MQREQLKAFEKLEKREHMIRYQRNRLALGRITRDEYNAEIARIDERFRLTEKERLACELYRKIQAEKQRRRGKK